ncbi:NAD-dependent epimerase/dehydratase family protein [Rhizobium sp. PAMB 3174]
MSNEVKLPVALVLGATGGIGGAVARTLKARGWTVRALNRNAAAMRGSNPEFEWRQGDALAAADVSAAASGVDLIVHAVNPPGYRDWEKLVLPMLDNSIAAATRHGARLLVPGTVYNFGPDARPNPVEDSPQNPVTRKGRIRVAFEQRLRKASMAGTQVVLVRAGDFFGAGAANNWFSQLVTPGKPVKAVVNPGRKGVGHQWAYLPDLAETMVRFVERSSSLPAYADYHFEGFWDHDGMQMARAIGRVVGKPDIRVRRFPWPLVYLASPFVRLFRELLEMRYLWQEPLHMTNGKLRAALGEEPRTPIEEAVRATLVSFGCLASATNAGGRSELVAA